MISSQYERNEKAIFIIFCVIVPIVAGVFSALLPRLIIVFIALLLIFLMVLLYLIPNQQNILSLLIVTSIFIAYGVNVGGIHFSLFRMSVIIGFLVFGLFFLTKGLPPRSGLYLALTFPFVIIYYLGVWRGRIPEQVSFKGLSFALTIGVIFLFIYFINDVSKFYKLMKVQIVTALGLSIYGLYEFVAFYKTGIRPKLPFEQFGKYNVIDKRHTSFLKDLNLLRVESFLNDGNILGIYLVCALLFLLVVYNRKKKLYIYKILSISAMVVISICLLLTLSRSALIALGVGLSYIFFHHTLKGNVTYITRVLRMTLIVCLAFTVIYLFSNSFGVYVDGIIYRFSISFQQSRRIAILMTGLGGFFKAPILGTGVGNLELYGAILHTAHSSIITILAETGIIGFSSFVIFLSPILLSIFRTFIRVKATNIDLVVNAIMLSLLIFELFYDTLFKSPTSMIMLAMGFSYALLPKIQRQ